MTKRRAPLSFESALTTVAALLGWDAVAAIVGKSDRAVRNWSDPDTSASITLDDALKLDAAFLAAGGDRPPFALTYSARLDAIAAAACATSAAIISASAVAAKEGGEAIAAALKASAPDATDADLIVAERELEESISAQTVALATIKRARGSATTAEGGQAQ